MKQYIWLVVLSCGLWAAGSLQAATRYDIHLVGGYVGGGYAGLLHSDQQMKFVGGGGGLLGFQYEYQYKKLLLNVGPEFRVFSSRDNLLYADPYSVALTADGYPQTKHYRFFDLHETQTVGQIMLPIMLGGSFDKVYFLAGAKVGYTVLGNYNQDGMLTTSITDDWAYDEWYDMPSHGLQTAAYAAKGKNAFGFDMTLSAEVGVNIDKLMSDAWQKKNEKRARPLRMRASVFVDYGLPNMNVSTSNAFATPMEADITTTSMLASDWATSRLNSLMVGVKFSALLQLNKLKAPKQPNPRLAIWVLDEDNNPLPATRVNIYREKNKRTSTKQTNKRGYVISRFAPGAYQITPSRDGYLPVETVRVQHTTDLRDTIVFNLKPAPVFACVVRDAKTNALVPAKLEFVDNKTGEVAHTLQADMATGQTKIQLTYGNTYTLNISAVDYIYQSVQVTDLGATVDYLLEPIVKGKKVVLRNLFFATNQTTILPESEESLQELYTFLKENPSVRIRIVGHTDNVGSDAANQTLSEGRASSVKNDIVGRGIAAERIETAGRGESEPVATNDTEEGRAQNRRVEFVIL